MRGRDSVTFRCVSPNSAWDGPGEILRSVVEGFVGEESFSHKWRISWNILYIVQTKWNTGVQLNKGEESNDRCSSDNKKVFPSIP